MHGNVQCLVCTSCTHQILANNNSFFLVPLWNIISQPSIIFPFYSDIHGDSLAALPLSHTRTHTYILSRSPSLTHLNRMSVICIGRIRIGVVVWRHGIINTNLTLSFISASISMVHRLLNKAFLTIMWPFILYYRYSNKLVQSCFYMLLWLNFVVFMHLFSALTTASIVLIHRARAE